MNMAHAVDSLLAGVQPGPSVALVAHKVSALYTWQFLRMNDGANCLIC